MNHAPQMARVACACAVLCALLATPAHAARWTTEGGTEIDFNSTLSFGLQWRLQKPGCYGIGNEVGSG